MAPPTDTPVRPITATHARRITRRKQLKYVSLFISFVAAVCTILSVVYDNWPLALGSGLAWLTSVTVDYYSTTIHGIGETRAERAKEAELAAAEKKSNKVKAAKTKKQR